MSKRKRDIQEDRRSRGGASKRVKTEEQDPSVVASESQYSKGGHDTVGKSPKVSKPRLLSNEEERALRKAEKRERRKQKKEQQAGVHTQEKKQEQSEVPKRSVKSHDSYQSKQKEDQKATQQAQIESQENGQVVAKSDEVKKPKKRRRKHRNEHEVQHDENQGWKVTEPIGGRLLDLDPIFSSNEEHLILACQNVVLVYSTATSLPVRYIRMRSRERISAFAISSLEHHELYVSATSGTIEKWDWTQGLQIGHWKLSSAIYNLTTSAQTSDQAKNELVYTIDGKSEKSPMFSAHRLNSGQNPAKTEVKTLLKYDQPLSFVKVLQGGRFVVATSAQQLIIGHSNSPVPASLQELSYTWRIVSCPEYIVSIDARVSYPEIDRKKSKGGKRKIESLDIAVGGLKGAIHIYENLLGNLMRREQPTSKDHSTDLSSRRLHWHRNGVLAVKWSLDGNYLISGGEETVLLIWQLETGKRQHLPHLGATIESVVVSPSGSSYAVRLADNSAMILSTSELQPTFSMAGIQLPTLLKGPSVNMPFIPTVSSPFAAFRSPRRYDIPACISALHPGSLLIAVPPSTPSRHVSAISHNCSYLQTVDLETLQQISRQALTRTKVTDLNMGPESNIIEEPNVTHIQTSSDGHWLLTVDEWMPPKRDLTSLTFDQDRLAEEQIFRQEIHLKFWLWKDETKTWELVSRIDNPHASRSSNPYEKGNVLDVASDPGSAGFATIGADGVVKTWMPAIRRRHGLNVQSKEGQNLTSWHCKHVVALKSADFATDGMYHGAKLAYSQDGSILAGAFDGEAITKVYIIDAYNGELCSVLNGLFDGSLFGLGFLDRYLIILSRSLCVLDLVSDEMMYGIDLHSHGLSLDDKRMLAHFAINVRQGQFAIAVPEIIHTSSNVSELRSKIALFNPTNAAPQFLTSATNHVIKLLPIAGGKGFVTIDSAAEVTRFTPGHSVQSIPLVSPKPIRESSHGIGNIFSAHTNAVISDDAVSDQDGLMKPDRNSGTESFHFPTEDTVVVNPEKLAEVFDVGPAYALPPVTELFEQVALLYNGRPAS